MGLTHRLTGDGDLRVQKAQQLNTRCKETTQTLGVVFLL